VNYIEIIGYAGAIMTTLAFLPQTIKTIKHKQTKDLSFWMYLIFTLGISCWFVYGLLINSLPIILANIVSFGFSFTILMLKIKYK